MAALPYMQLYVADYLADTAHLTTEEHGAYVLLLFSYWQTGKALKAERLSSISRLSNERWTNVEQTLAEFFHVKNGVWTHKRVEADLEKAGGKSRKNSEAGKKSALARSLAKQELERDETTSVQRTLQRTFNHARSRDTDTDTDTDTEDQKHMSSGKPNDVPMAERIPYKEILDLYHENLKSLPRVRLFDEARKKAIRSRWLVDERFQKLEFWAKFFSHIDKSDFLMGRTKDPWSGCGFDWILKPANFKKIVEGNYNREQS
jgi:uncharacterized protein YdaU (DUF1376 family)